ncbi:MAG: hypothetical protein AABY03_02125 [Nanoarchaeota archaeon]
MKRNGELNVPVIILGIFGFAVFGLAVSYIYFAINGTDYSESYLERISSGEIKNPFLEEDENGEIIVKIDEDLNLTDLEEEALHYALVELQIYNLHDIPFTSQSPRIEVEIDTNTYAVEVINGEIEVNVGDVKKEDIIIKTTQEEIIKMVNNEGYAQESFSSGNSEIEKVANDFVLFSKGYLDLYNELG